jgi:type II secretory pathway pseudopilin PulG
MKFASIGTRAASPSSPRDHNNREAGFTLLEALASLTLILAFAAALTPLLFHARRIMINADGRVAAAILARALIQEPLDRGKLADLAQNGTTEGLDWQLRSEPTDISAAFPPPRRPTPSAPAQNAAPATSLSNNPTAAPSNGTSSGPSNGSSSGPWVAYHIVASVTWAPGQEVRAETVRLGKAE